MPRGRHRHSPPLHRLLPSSAIAGVSVVCALGPWVFSEAAVVRALAALAALTAVGGAVVMRRWDAQAGRQVADLTRARASDEWRFEERVAELETDLEDSRELRTKLEHRLRAKRAELAGLRNEHAALLRRYATAETERASALEGRRLLEIESGEPSGALALPPARSAEPEPRPESRPVTAPGVPAETADAAPARPVFSAQGAPLYRQAAAALSRLDPGTRADAGTATPQAEPAEAAKGAGAPEGVTDLAAEPDEDRDEDPASDGDPAETENADDAEDGGHARAQAAPEAPAEAAGRPGQRPAGHFTVPTAVAVVPPAPARRPHVEGGFDFFGTQKQDGSAALDSVQNEDLADVVGQEALALHKADTEHGYKAAEDTREAGQVIDLTEHDETEHIDVQRLRSAVS